MEGMHMSFSFHAEFSLELNQIAMQICHSFVSVAMWFPWWNAIYAHALFSFWTEPSTPLCNVAKSDNNKFTNSVFAARCGMLWHHIHNLYKHYFSFKNQNTIYCLYCQHFDVGSRLFVCVLSREVHLFSDSKILLWELQNIYSGVTMKLKDVKWSY